MIMLVSLALIVLAFGGLCMVVGMWTADANPRQWWDSAHQQQAWRKTQEQAYKVGYPDRNPKI